MSGKLMHQALEKYLERLVPPRPEQMQKMESVAQQSSFPIIGPVCGHLCYQIARMIGAERIFELGSGLRSVDSIWNREYLAVRNRTFDFLGPRFSLCG